MLTLRGFELLTSQLFATSLTARAGPAPLTVHDVVPHDGDEVVAVAACLLVPKAERVHHLVDDSAELAFAISPNHDLASENFEVLN